MHLSSSSRACFNVTSVSTSVVHSEPAELHTIVGCQWNKFTAAGDLSLVGCLLLLLLSFLLRYRCSTSSKRNASFTTCHRTFDWKTWVLVINWRVNTDVHRKRWIREDDASSQRPRGMRLGALTHWLPAKSSFFESPPRRSPQTPVPSCAPAVCERRCASPSSSRAGTNHFSPNFVFLLCHRRAELNVSLDGCSGGLYLDDGVLRGAYLKNREERLSLCTCLSLFTHTFSACCDMT